jgi:hypothetical protein
LTLDEFFNVVVSEHLAWPLGAASDDHVTQCAGPHMLGDGLA